MPTTAPKSTQVAPGRGGGLVGTPSPSGGTGNNVGLAGGGGNHPENGANTQGNQYGGNNGNNLPRPADPRIQQIPQLQNVFGGQPNVVGGPTQGAIANAGQSFSNPSPLQGAIPFWQSPGIQVGAQHGYDPGQTYASQLAGTNMGLSQPYVQAALNNFNMNVAPGIQDQMNTAGLGRSSAAADAMAKAQASILPSLYSQAAGLEQNQINNQIQAGQFSAGLSQQDLSRLQGATESELGRRQQASQQQQQGQQQLFQNLMSMAQMQNSQQMGGAAQLFGQGTQAQQTGQMANQNAYQDFLRQQGLSEEAINPFGGISGLLGTITTGK